MGDSLFRSQEMTHFKLYIPLEICQQTVAEFGELSLVEFRDLNPDVNAFQRTFVNEIRRLDEMDRKLRFLSAQMEKSNISSKRSNNQLYYSRTRTQNAIDLMEERLTDHEIRLNQMNNSQEALKKRFLELTELRHVLRETATFFDQSRTRNSSMDEALHSPTTEGAHLLSGAIPQTHDDSLHVESGDISGSLNFVAGVISRQRMGIFERILFRALRGNLYMNFAEIPDPIIDPVTDEPQAKNVFCIFAHGKELVLKIKKICESLGATLYPVDDKADKRRSDALEVLDNTDNARRVELAKVAESSEVWAGIIVREKAIYYAMNMFSGDSTKRSLIAEGWCPTSSIPQIKYALSGVTERTGSTVAPIFNEHPTTKQPPTYHKTNKFTVGFQEIVDAYGIATYREVNPGLFTTITFPFLFAVMFGDFGHGVVICCFAIWMCVREKSLTGKNWGEFWSMLFGGRYMILLMGLFSCYTGMIYNDVFSKAFNIFGSGWLFKYEEHSQKYVGEKIGVYPFGIDPAWHNSDNNLLFNNSYKMKMAIVFGVIHMSFGICLNVFNFIHFNKRRSIWAEFVPQITFLMSIFGYLVILIIYKWMTPLSYWDSLVPKKNPPGLLNTLIYMFLSPGNVTYENEIYPGQSYVQSVLLLLAFICVPWMLCTKPYLEYKDHHRARDLGYDAANRHSMDSTPGASNIEELTHDEEEEWDFSEIVVHQVIHTIEFCLGAISNTASYLRLWALSLAHAQLSEVLWEMVLNSVVHMNPNGFFYPIALVIGFYFWFSMTVVILIGMEGLSAFLHAMRLHWVEFQNKFYVGSGKKFISFSFEKLDSSEGDE